MRTLLIILTLFYFVANAQATNLKNGKILSQRLWADPTVTAKLFMERISDTPRFGSIHETVFTKDNMDQLIVVSNLIHEVKQEGTQKLAGSVKLYIENLTSDQHTYHVYTRMCSVALKNCAYRTEDIVLSAGGKMQARETILMNPHYKLQKNYFVTITSAVKLDDTKMIYQTDNVNMVKPSSRS